MLHLFVTNYEQALQWIDQAIAQNNSTENELNTYGYTLLNNKDYDKAIEIFILNTKRFPNSANSFSLGEAYATKGDKKNAIASFKKIT